MILGLTQMQGVGSMEKVPVSSGVKGCALLKCKVAQSYYSHGLIFGYLDLAGKYCSL